MAVRWVVLLMLLPAVARTEFKVVLYYTTNPNFRAMNDGDFNGGLPPWEIDWTGVTHIVCSINEDNVDTLEPYYTQISGNDSLEAEFGAMHNGQSPPYVHYLDSTIAIAHRQGIKVLTCVCQLFLENGPLITIAADSALTDSFASALAQYCDRKGFDGVEFDVEGEESTYIPISADMYRLLRRTRAYMDIYVPGGIVSTAAGRMECNYYPAGADAYVDWYDPQFYGDGGFWCGTHNYNEGFPIPPIYRGVVHDSLNAYSVAEDRGADDVGGMASWIAAGHSASKMVVGQMMEAIPFIGVDSIFNNAGWSHPFANWCDIDSMIVRGGSERWDNVRKGSWVGGTATETFYYDYVDTVHQGDKFMVQRLSLQAADTLVAWIKAGNYGGIMLYDVQHGRSSHSVGIENKADRIPLLKRIVAAVGTNSSSQRRMFLRK